MKIQSEKFRTARWQKLAHNWSVNFEETKKNFNLNLALGRIN